MQHFNGNNPPKSLPPTVASSSVRSSLNNIKTYAGSGPSTAASGTGGPALSATFDGPRTIVMDSTGVFYIDESYGSCIRKITTSNIVVAFPGTCGTSSFSGDNGPAASSTINCHVRMVLDTVGNFYSASLVTFPGGDSSSVHAYLSIVAFVVGNNGAFAAITSTSSVVAWGDSTSGGQLLANVSSAIGSGVSSIYHTSRAFAVVNGSGAVTVWGRSSVGGGLSATLSGKLNEGVRLLCANDNAFTAIKSDGTTYAWGSAKCVSGGGLLSGNYSSVRKC